ncbi:MAG: SOS response-associated peptidase [Nitriliruptorales bacterium]
MCGRFAVFTEQEELARLFEVDAIRTEPLPARYNVAPTLEVYAVVETADRERRLGALTWGLVPPWAKEPRPGPINARAETVTEKPAFRDAFVQRRCIIPADGFYEWITDPATGGRLPSFIHREDGHPLAFAGLWSRWRPKGGRDPLNTCTIMTTEAAPPVAALHDRMPVMLDSDAWDLWLDPGQRDVGRLTELVAPVVPKGLTTRRVPTLVNDVRNEGPELAAPL